MRLFVGDDIDVGGHVQGSKAKFSGSQISGLQPTQALASVVSLTRFKETAFETTDVIPPSTDVDSLDCGLPYNNAL